MSDCTKCEWHNPMWGTQDGSFGAAKADHDRVKHPNHEHTWGDSTYEFEQKGYGTIVVPSGRFPLKETVQRCTVCNVRQSDY